MEKNIVDAELKNSAYQYGLLIVFNYFSPNIQVRIPMLQALRDTSVDELSFSACSQNGIKRAGARTVGDVSNLIMSENGLSGVRIPGEKSISKIKTAFLNLAYSNLNEREKAEFGLYVVENNGGRDYAVC